MKKCKSILWFLLFILILGVNSIGYGIDFEIPSPNDLFYVYDEANILDDSLESYIIATNEQLYEKTGAQIVVVTLESLDGNSEQEIAVKLFRNWGIGSKEKNNGVLMLIAPNERRLWIEIGYGLEGALPDGKVGSIRDNYIFPYFVEEDYNSGVEYGFNAILSEIAIEYNIEENFDISEYPNSQYNEENLDSESLGIKPVFAIIGIAIFLFIDFKFFGGMLTFMIIRSSSRGGFGSSGRRGGNRGGGGSSGGGGAGGGW